MVQVRADGAASPGVVLDLHEGLSHPGPAELRGLDGRYPDPRRDGCPRWPAGLWLLSSLGERVPGRCKGPNQCDYCARLAAVENSEMLALDAMEGDAPQVWAVLTTRTATWDMALFYDARRLVMRAVRRRWPGAEYASLLEFTTGYGPRSGGARRPHWNLLLKGVPVGALDQVRELVVRVWCDHVDAEAPGQHVAAIAEAGGLMRYIALHFQKESQAPPPGFHGQRFNCSRRYFTGKTRAEAREDARLALSEKRALWKLARHTGLTGDALEDAYEAHLAAVGFPEWRLYSEPREEVNDASEADARPAPESTGAAGAVGRVLDSPAPGRVGDGPDVDVTSEGRVTEGAAAARGQRPAGGTPRLFVPPPTVVEWVTPPPRGRGERSEPGDQYPATSTSDRGP